MPESEELKDITLAVSAKRQVLLFISALLPQASKEPGQNHIDDLDLIALT